jgi:AcrR family transcriptional regulator
MREIDESRPGEQLPAFAAPPERPVRRRQEDRSRDAREKLLNATIEVLLNKGYNGLTTKDVAQAAGLSNGALMHHYANKAELVIAATARVYEEALLRGQRRAQLPDAVDHPLEGFLSDCLSVYFDWPFIAALEIIVVSRTDAQLMEQMLPVMENFRVNCDRTWMAVFRRAGVAEAKATELLNLTLNLVRGMAVNRLWRRDDAHYREFLDAWLVMANRELRR